MIPKIAEHNDDETCFTTLNEKHDTCNYIQWYVKRSAFRTSDKNDPNMFGYEYLIILKRFYNTLLSFTVTVQGCC